MGSDYSLAKITALLFYYPINFPNTGLQRHVCCFLQELSSHSGMDLNKICLLNS